MGSSIADLPFSTVAVLGRRHHVVLALRLFTFHTLNSGSVMTFVLQSWFGQLYHRL